MGLKLVNLADEPKTWADLLNTVERGDQFHRLQFYAFVMGSMLADAGNEIELSDQVFREQWAILKDKSSQHPMEIVPTPNGIRITQKQNP